MPLFDFDKSAATYDLYYQSDFGRSVDLLEKKCIDNLLEHLDGEKILEIGSGTGHWTEYLTRKGFRVMALDISGKMLEQLQKKNLPLLGWIRANAEELPFDDNSFDNIITITTLEFVDNLDKTLQEIKRVLKPGGHFVAGVLNINSELGKNKSKNETFAKARFFDRNQLADIMQSIGQLLSMDGCVVLEEGKIIDMHQELPSDTRLEKGAFLCAIARKPE